MQLPGRIEIVDIDDPKKRPFGITLATKNESTRASVSLYAWTSEPMKDLTKAVTEMARASYAEKD